MPDLSFRTVLSTEREMLDGAARQLAIFDKEVEAAQDQVGEQVYASLLTALDAANAAYNEMVSVVQMASQASQAGQIALQLLPPTMADVAQQMAAQPQQKAAAVNQIILSLRLCSLRPSDIWRNEIRIQAGALLERMFNALASNAATPDAVEKMAEIYTSAFCWFEAAWFEDKPSGARSENGGSFWSHLFSLKGAALVGISALAGYFGGNFAVEQYQNYFGGSGDVAGEIGEGEGDEEESEEEEVIIDIPTPDEVGGAI